MPIPSVSTRSSPVASVPRDLSDREFETFRALVAAHTGIALGPNKRVFLQARLGKRLRALGLPTFTEYRRVLAEQDPHGEELIRFVNAVTTNRTTFYREAQHFAYLAEQWGPAALGTDTRGGPRVARIWSAGCSTGEEPYTIAMALADALGATSAWTLRILASDINTDALTHAAAGTYGLDDIGQIPRAVLTRHFLRGVGPNAGLVRLRPALRDLVTFRRINLLEERWPIQAPFDVIFCRNVLIYFNRPTQQRVLARLVGFLKIGGVLVLGHSEGVHGMVGGLRHVGNTIYHKEVDDAGDDPHR